MDGAPLATPGPGGSSASNDLVSQARRVADSAAARAAVTTSQVDSMEDLRLVSALWESVWGRNEEGVPINSEVLRALSHAGGAVTVARDRAGTIVGGAVAALSAGHSTYSLIAACRIGDHGVGHAVKLRQREWALGHGRTRMFWTFDPLVARNARFNLSKLGVTASEYVENFYGAMGDGLNGGDISDRLVASWDLVGTRAVRASEGPVEEPQEPVPQASPVLLGPDHEPAYIMRKHAAWCRVPQDTVSLRRTDPGVVAAWRSTVREAFSDAFSRHLHAVSMSRNGWYQLVQEDTT